MTGLVPATARSLLAAAAVAAIVLVLAADHAAGAVRPPRYDRCGTKSERTHAIAFRAGDGQRLVGLLLGKGKTGVVLGHQFRSNLCEWLPFARTLVASGFRVLAFDFRDNGSGGAIDLDMLGAARALTSRGAAKIVLVGGSMGGTAALVAAPRVGQRLGGVVNLSGPAQFQALDAAAAVGQLDVPALFVASQDDEPFVNDVRALYEADPQTDKTLEIAPGSAHGASILAVRRERVLVLGFLRRVSRGAAE